MSTQALTSQDQMMNIARNDLVAAWSLLERMVVSNRKIGGHFAHPVGQPQTPEQRQQMIEAFMAYFSPDFFREISQVRSMLDKYINDDEGETLSDSLKYWEPRE